MKTGHVVIGANYGDEGKGLITDYLSSRRGKNCLVVRYNGGAQAGHTVVTPEGKRHVFSHFGSGAFNNVPTLLGPRFIANPILWHTERQKALALGLDPLVYIDPTVRITTPMDMWLNMAAEDARGAQRHGSVGVGIFETTVRHDEYPVYFSEIQNEPRARRQLEAIVGNWLPERARTLGCEEQYLAQRPVFDLHRFLADWYTMYQQLDIIANSAGIVERTDHPIFEGAQGLALSEEVDRKYSTPSSTGLLYVSWLFRGYVVPEAAHLVYVTRPYITRHGAGPLPYEQEGPPGRARDTTNVDHPYQGKLRYALLDVDALWERIRTDAVRAHPRTKLSLAVTCLDQLDTFAWVQAGKVHNGTEEQFLAALTAERAPHSLFLSRGETRATVTERVCSEPESLPPVQIPMAEAELRALDEGLSVYDFHPADEY